MAEKYFDDMNNDVHIVGKRHFQKSVEGYNRLPDVFTADDVGKCFGYQSESSIYVKLKRLIDNKMVEVSDEYIENGRKRNRYRKIQQLIL